MAVISLEMRLPDFLSLASATLRASPIVPLPYLPSMGADRLIRRLEWLGQIQAVNGVIDSFPAQPGRLILLASVRLWHVSVAELKLDPGAPGIQRDLEAWIMVTAGAQSVGLDLVALDGVLPTPVRVATLPLPNLWGAGAAKAAIDLRGWSIVVRLATKASDNIAGAPAPGSFGPADTVSGNWLLRVPGGFFADMILARIEAGLAPPPAGMVVEEQASAQWTNVSPTMLGQPLLPDMWGVHAAVGLMKPDACETLFGDVDISVDVTANAAFAANEANQTVDITLTVSTDASDWDSFRCWLGSGGIAGIATALALPVLGFEVALGSLIFISETIRREVGGAVGRPIDQFTKIGSTDSSVTYASSIPVQVLPFSTLGSFAFDDKGLTIIGTIYPLSPAHLTSFVPGQGPLAGAWEYRINCSHRSFDSKYVPQKVIIHDDRTLFGEVVRSLPVAVYATSVGEPLGKCWVGFPAPAPHLSVPIGTSGLAAGDNPSVVIHTSAGLRAYTVAAVPQRPLLALGATKLMNTYCDTFHNPSMEIEIQQLKWIEPKIAYGYGEEALRQWQIVIDRILDLDGVEVHASGDSGESLIATGADFSGGAGRAAIEIITDARTELGLRLPDPGKEVRYAVTRRWLLPLHRVPLRAPVTSLRRNGGEIELRAADLIARLDLNSWRLGAFEPTRDETPSGRQSRRSISLPGGKVASLHDGHLLIAAPVSTLSGAAPDEAANGGSQAPAPKRRPAADRLGKPDRQA